MKIALRNHTLDLGARPHVMGILNVTPDSFYDGGKYAAADAAVARAREMVSEGADIIDVGGESTRPGSPAVDAREEILRIGPVVEALLRSNEVPISVDTRKAPVAAVMLRLGAHMINDVSGLGHDPEMVRVVREFDVPLVIMHMRGTPETMQQMTAYDDVVAEVKAELAERVRHAEAGGIGPDRIVVDPGIGFAKTAEQNIEIIARLDEFADLGKPVLIGPSMKSFIGKTLGLEPGDRGEATIACCVAAAARGARLFRVHDVAGVVRALAMADRIEKVGKPGDRKVDA
jgi:dihydropteroate synthase